MAEAQFGAFVAVGFVAQLIDGALGMAYGVCSSTFLLGLGVPPAVASGAVHTAKVFTNCASGLSHLALRNVDRRLFSGLVLPGVLGAVIGAAVATRVPGELLRPVVSVYLLGMGIRLIRTAVRGRQSAAQSSRGLRRLGLVGGFCDAVGGGGWGPVVTSTLLVREVEPRLAVGSVNAAEFFVAVAAATVFAGTVGMDLWRAVAGLVLGGLVAAPLAAGAVRRIPAQRLMLLVGAAVVLLSLRNLALWLA